jgi:DNA-directed RNA polymerase subunit RPC12/RpoP
VIDYPCPACSAPLTSPDEDEGRKMSCPDCGKNFRVPRLRRNRIASGPAEDEERLDDLDVSRRRRRDRYEDDWDDDWERDQRRRCPYCGCKARPRYSKEMGTTAWVMVALGVLFWPLILVGLLGCMEEHWRCRDCNRDLGRADLYPRDEPYPRDDSYRRDDRRSREDDY